MLIHRSELAEQATAAAELRGRRAASEDLAQLTRRHQEVAATVAEGLTNEEITERLMIAPRRVANDMQKS